MLEDLRRDCVDSIERVDYAELTGEEFVRRFVQTKTPVIVRGVVDSWKGREQLNWKVRAAEQAMFERFKHREFKVGESDSGRTLRVEFKHFLEYLVSQRDDSPLYLFESSFHKRGRAPELLDMYEVPKFFREDLLPIVGEKARPPYRWLLMGPRRSGTTLHLDPLMTSAWNTSLQGHKL